MGLSTVGKKNDKEVRLDAGDIKYYWKKSLREDRELSRCGVIECARPRWAGHFEVYKGLPGRSDN